MRNQPPVHEPALVTALVSDNNGNRRRNLFGSDVKARNVFWQIAVEVPANPNVTKLKRSCHSATHLHSYSGLPGGTSTVIVMSKHRLTSRLADKA